ncbi:hypothetical protein QJS04_geneDACA003639 [Acorus gramineus]|uniref:UBA domain-containing protein n=1 Tax=Acorus gramineus TaxID=55184 RepID=A0AAV9BQC8_ACOGR|nr:hypothetical protein QJS04_geneDACA003639 [Acorus gramineus]
MAASKPLKRQYHSGVSIGTSTEYDSVSNNESCSGESAEDQKEKLVAAAPTNHRSDVILGSDMDKREKIRQQNEKKHQHQRERRAQELHELCNSYLMSRKLEALAQQLVAMGFTSERATMALILNDGRVEGSVNWLLQGGEEGTEQVDVSTLSMGGNLKLDMSEEHKRIADIELRFKCSKREVERAVIACDGDLEKAMETLKARNQEPPPPTSTAPPKVGLNTMPSSRVSPSLSSLGFFTGRTSLGTSGSSLSSLVDWNTDGRMPQLDYNSIDWSVDWSSASGSGGPLYRPSSSHKGLSRPPQASKAYLAVPAPVDGQTVRPGGSAPTPADAAVGGCRVGCLNGNPLMGMISCRASW